MAYKVAICDDCSADISYLSSMVENWAKGRGILVRIETFPSAEAFLFLYEEKKDYDLLLLDIEMGDMDGVAMAKRIRRENEAVSIVFITGYSDYIAEGYEVAALHYLVKPVQKEKLFAVLDRAREKSLRNERTLLLETAAETVRLPLYEIRYLEVWRNYVTVHGKRDYQVKRPLREMEKELDESFLRIGRSCILNLACVRRVTKTEVTLDDATVLSLPRGMYEPLNRAIISYKQ